MTYGRLAALCALLVLGAASPLSAQTTAPAPIAHPPQAAPPHPDSSNTLIDANGLALYWYRRDGIGTSVCTTAPCTTNWPPFLATPDARAGGDFTIITRPDGSRQWALDGQPLYYWKNDLHAGDRKGDGLAGVWHLAKVSE